MPSIKPSKAELAPSDARSAGIAAVAISWPTSEKRLASPMPRMLRLSQRNLPPDPNSLGEDLAVFRAIPVMNYPDLLQGHQTAAHHLVENRKKTLHLFLGVDNLDDGGRSMESRRILAV